MSARDAVLAWSAAVERRYREARPRSEALAMRARGLLPGGETRVGSAVPPFGPIFAAGHGEELTDVDGNVVLDTTHNATSLIHGHANPTIVEAATRQIVNGTQWLGLNPHTIELADLIVDRVPSVERIRFTNSGSEANGLMVKVARAFTGRDVILKLDASYHGSHDIFEFGPSSGGDRSRGTPIMEGIPRNLPDNILIGRFNDADGVVELIERNADRLAAVLLTPVISVGMLSPRPGFLEAIREATQRAGVLLLFDEVISLRVARGGAQERFGVTPDMTSMAKIIGGGFPIGAYGGRADIMALTDPTDGTQRVSHAGTFNGNPVSAAAGVASLELLTPEAYVRLDDAGRRLERAIRTAIDTTRAPFFLNRTASLLYLEFTPSAPAAPSDDTDEWTELTAMVRRRLPTAWLSHGLLGSAVNASTTVTDEQIDEVGRRFTAAMAELMSHVGDVLPTVMDAPRPAVAVG
jgi:glutamate-1-semialdehyde 2,1-aminomutase